MLKHLMSVVSLAALLGLGSFAGGCSQKIGKTGEVGLDWGTHLTFHTKTVDGESTYKFELTPLSDFISNFTDQVPEPAPVADGG